jgi:hypothetical protein
MKVKPSVRELGLRKSGNLSRASLRTWAAQVWELGLRKSGNLGCASPETIQGSGCKNILSRLDRRDFKVFFSISLFFPFNFKVALYYKHATTNSNLIVFHDTKQDKDIKH